MSKTPAQLRGYLSRFLLEVRTGVFVGSVSTRVRHGMWGEIKSNMVLESSAIMMWSDETKEQGFDFISLGDTKECDLDGFTAIMSEVHRNSASNKTHNHSKEHGWSKARKRRQYAR